MQSPEADRAGGHLILYVEDEAPNRALLRAVMSRASEPELRAATIVEANDLASARVILGERAVDLLLLDVRLPDGNGLDLLREIRGRDAPTQPAIVVMSASVLSTERDAAVAAGADRFLAKPYAPAALLEIVAEQLRRRRSRDV
jgi:two-component system, OmpR family, KDP operon response regulator KdpE